MEKNQILEEVLRDLGEAANAGHKIERIALGKRSWTGNNGGLFLLPLAPPHFWLIRFLIGPSQKLAEDLTSEPKVEIELASVTGVRRMELPVIDPLYQKVVDGRDILYSVSLVVEIPDLEFPAVSIRNAFWPTTER